MFSKKVFTFGLTSAILLSGTTAFAADTASLTPQDGGKQQDAIIQKAEELGINTQGMDKKQLKQAIREQSSTAKTDKLYKLAAKLGIDTSDPDLTPQVIRQQINNYKLNQENAWLDEQAAKYGISPIGHGDSDGLSPKEFKKAVQAAYLADQSNQDEIQKQLDKLTPAAEKLGLDTTGLNIFQLKDAIAVKQKQGEFGDLDTEAALYGVDISGMNRKDALFAIHAAKQDARDSQIDTKASELGIDTEDMTPDDVMDAIHQKDPQWHVDMSNIAPASQASADDTPAEPDWNSDSDDEASDM